MQIGQLIARSGASAKAIRLYESRGLLGPVPRRGTYRCYDVSHLERLLLIRQAQSVGFSLAELEPLLRGVDTPDWALLRQHLQAKRQAVRAELARLRRLDARLGEVDEEIARCLDDTARADDVLCNTSAPSVA